MNKITTTTNPLQKFHTIGTILGVALLMAIVTVTPGCDQAGSAPAEGGLGMIDLERVASELGRTQTMQQTLMAQEQAAQQTIGNIQKQYAQQLDQMRARVGETPTAEQEQELAQFVRGAQQRMQREIGNAQQQLERTRITLSSQFRDEIKPYIRQLAEETHKSAILFKSDSLVLYATESVDMTDALINKLIAAGQKTSTSPTPPASPSNPNSATSQAPPVAPTPPAETDVEAAATAADNSQ